jgi:hypothetical protein
MFKFKTLSPIRLERALFLTCFFISSLKPHCRLDVKLSKPSIDRLKGSGLTYSVNVLLVLKLITFPSSIIFEFSTLPFLGSSAPPLSALFALFLFLFLPLFEKFLVNCLFLV